VDLSNKNITGKAAENALHEAGITVNKNMVPFDTKSPFVTSGIRLGTAALTTKGMREMEIKQISGFIHKILSNIGDEEIYKSIYQEIHELNKNYQLYAV